MEVANSTDHQRQSYIIKVTKTGRLITCKTRHIQYTDNKRVVSLGADKKGTGQLEDIFTQARSVEQGWVIYPYTSNTLIHILQNYGWNRNTKNTPIQQTPKTNYIHSMSHGRLDCVTRSDASWNMIMKSGQRPIRDVTRTRSGQMSHRLEKIGIDT